ncbi:pyridoxamine 5'-phosphate oxidase family protein [Ferruginibacter paludis]|uniref:pyridoxamine 5'-phosphate oxidase family protein n=1 Tax=Ferruginibacter paludis TaxID=1310417 RepID=UPI0025B2A3BF|nr:pyridoxamine 5'-phosphate oxidase family protein [Ferruginibacter paludis]MDN3654383.1 pyridoxamine 5'-phosphate oxidase family protein [Ferruginibacter paludis]
MAKNFAAIAYSDAVKEMQEKLGSRATYARMERDTYIDGLTDNEVDFIAQRDSFYMASIGENGFPYIQHRGGPKGFLKVLDSKRIGFIDFKGNMQYITVGNLATNNNVALIMVDYPARARLKIYAKAEIIELKNNPELYHLLDLGDYKFRPERMMVLTIEAYDWNCPQHITPRYSAEEIEQAFAPQRKRMAQLEEEVKVLKTRIKEAGIDAGYDG